ncbi:MAG: ion transporter [Gemmatimonadetes bacterium]|nr:ion transporter [Gemmatimonadota bacterium]NNM06742.1 ion transporter [Gemmatimonadota bacterium]
MTEDGRTNPGLRDAKPLNPWRGNPKVDDWRPVGGPRWKSRTYDVIFLHDTPAGKTFDVALIAVILVSVAIVMLDSVESIVGSNRTAFRVAEWIFTVVFSIEYVLRLLTVRRASKYALSFFGVIDLLAVLPTYLSLLIPGGQYLIVIRILRVLRVFRVLKLAQYVGEARVLGAAMMASRYKITVFLFTVLTIVVVVGSMMFLIEGSESGFTSIPRGVYWAIVTLTTVGYGDIHPVTPVGQLLASLVMIMGYGIIAVPTGIVTVELANQARQRLSKRTCPGCSREDHVDDAEYCRGCGEKLEIRV